MEILIPFAFFGMIIALVVVPIWLKERTKQSAHQLISKALEKGQTLDPALIDKLTETSRIQQQDRPRKTLGSGVIMLALAGAFAGASYFSGDFDPTGHAMGGMMTAALILGALGAAFTLLAIVDYAAKKKSDAA